ncbi:hypothetical protein ACOK4R_31895 (plasmid) [Pseudomonas fluorescens]|uniref:hypothetical protein n=1 Tax=Pseudomonas fluorescens TaxID=294 RepID=UPI001FD38E9E|nr:hypothetical protein [Pseudomonas fluorescens]
MSDTSPRRPVELISKLALSSIKSYPPAMIESLKRGAMYDICVEILRTHMASGKKSLDDVCISHLGAGRLDSDSLNLAAAIALSKPTMDYEELLSYALTLNEERDIRTNLNFVIDSFGYRPSFYHYFISQDSHDEVMVKLFDLDVMSAAQDVAVHCDLAALRRLAKLTTAKDEKTLIGQTLAAIPHDQASRIRVKLTGATAMSNFEFTSRMDKFFSQKAGLTMGSDGKDTVPAYTTAQVMNLPDFQEKMAKNAGTVVNLFYRAVRATDRDDAAQALESIEKDLIVPILKVPEQRMSLFFSQALSKSDSWIADVLESDDGGRSYYLQMLLDYVAKGKNAALGVARAFVRLEPVGELLPLCSHDATLANLYKLTSNKAYLQKVSAKGRDRTFSADLGL